MTMMKMRDYSQVVTQEDIDHALTTVQNVHDDFKEKEHLQYQVEYAQYLFVKVDVDQFLKDLSTEITLPEGFKIGDSISELLLKDNEIEHLQVRVDSLGTTVQEGLSGNKHVSGEVKYLGVNEEGELILNRLPVENQTEYVDLSFRVGERYIDDTIIKINIPATSDTDENSSVTIIEEIEDVDFIKDIHDYSPNHSRIYLSGEVNVNKLTSNIKAKANGAAQSYQIKDKDGKVKSADDQLVPSDKLIVTAANGVSKRIYEINFPIYIDEIIKGDLGHFTIKAKNTSVQHLKDHLLIWGYPQDYSRNEKVNFTIQQSTTDEYEVSITGAQKNYHYNLDSNNNTIPVWNSRHIIWRSFEVVDAHLYPEDNTAILSNLDGLSLTADNIQVEFSDNGEDWLPQAEVDGLSIGTKVEPAEEGKFKITFTKTGTFDGELNHQGHLYINVIADGIENQRSIELRILEDGNLAVY